MLIYLKKHKCTKLKIQILLITKDQFHSDALLFIALA